MDNFLPLFLYKNRDKLAQTIRVDDSILKVLKSRNVLLEPDVAHLSNCKLLDGNTLAHELLRVIAVREDGYNNLLDVLTRVEQFESVLLLTDGLHEEFQQFEEFFKHDVDKGTIENLSKHGGPKLTALNVLGGLITSFDKWKGPFGQGLGVLSKISRSVSAEYSKQPQLIPQAYPISNTKAWYYYDHNSLIGRGATSDVFVGHWGSDKNQKVAVKITYKTACSLSTIDLPSVTEIQTKGDTTTNYVVPMFAFAEVENAYFIVTELAATTLEKGLASNFQNISNDKSKLIKVLESVCNGLHWLRHNKSSVQRDIKPQNVMLYQYSDSSNDDVVIAKLEDFGLSCKPDKGAVGVDAQKIWMSPEALIAMENDTSVVKTEKMEIFSLGMLFYWCLSGGKHPFQIQIEDNVEENIKDPNVISCPLEIAHFRFPACDNLVQWMLQKNSERRPKISQVRAHPMFWDEEKCLSFLEDVCRSMKKNDSASEWKEIRENLDENYKRYFRSKYGYDFDWVPLVDLRLFEMEGGDEGGRLYESDSLTSLVELIRDKAQDMELVLEDVENQKGLLDADTPFDKKIYAENFLPLFPDIVIALFGWLARAAGFYACLRSLKEKYFELFLDPKYTKCWSDD